MLVFWVVVAASEPRALEALSRSGAEVRISYDTTSTRLHAKAWLFERQSGFSTALIGSSNLSNTALVDGLEWNVRLSTVDTPTVLDTFRATFESYWADAHVEPLRGRRASPPPSDAKRPGSRRPRCRPSTSSLPAPARILEQLEAERERHGRWRNLVVAATGTGKTVVAALDYRRLRAARGGDDEPAVRRPPPGDPRPEPARRSATSCATGLRRGLRRRPNARPSGTTCSRRCSRSPRWTWRELAPDHFDMVIVDEFHHAAAPTYARLLNHLRPEVLLGLTATPSAPTAQSVTDWFDGRVRRRAAPVGRDRTARSSCPFQYFGVHDDVDLSALDWKRGGLRPRRARRTSTPATMRELGKILRAAARHRHRPARGCARSASASASPTPATWPSGSTRRGIPSVAVSARDAERTNERRRCGCCAAGEVNCVFAVDLFNEGIDVPGDRHGALPAADRERDRLPAAARSRPSPRRRQGLPDRARLHRPAAPRVPLRPPLARAARIGQPRRELTRAVEEGFPLLPLGLPHPARSGRAGGRPRATSAPPSGGDVGRAGRRSSASIGDVLARRATCSAPSAELGGASTAPTAGWSRPTPRRRLLDRRPPATTTLRSAGPSAACSTSTTRSAWAPTRELLARSDPPVGAADREREQRLLTMLHFDLWGTSTADASRPPRSGLRDSGRNPARLDELRELLAVLDDRADVVPPTCACRCRSRSPSTAATRRDEALAAVGVSVAEQPRPSRRGVRRRRQAATSSS